MRRHVTSLLLMISAVLLAACPGKGPVSGTGTPPDTVTIKQTDTLTVHDTTFRTDTAAERALDSLQKVVSALRATPPRVDTVVRTVASAPDTIKVHDTTVVQVASKPDTITVVDSADVVKLTTANQQLTQQYQGVRQSLDSLLAVPPKVVVQTDTVLQTVVRVDTVQHHDTVKTQVVVHDTVLTADTVHTATPAVVVCCVFQDSSTVDSMAVIQSNLYPDQVLRQVSLTGPVIPYRIDCWKQGAQVTCPAGIRLTTSDSLANQHLVSYMFPPYIGTLNGVPIPPMPDASASPGAVPPLQNPE